MKDDFRYMPEECFETFAFPEVWHSHSTLESAGREYHEYRAELMVRRNEGLTKTYNRFQDPAEHDAGIVRLRELHAAMDRVVLDAYGWNDIDPTSEFILDYDDDEDDEPSRASKRKKPWRYRWPDDVRDDVLARLLALNLDRSEKSAGPDGAAVQDRSMKKSPSKALSGRLFS
ncbi:MAG: hypothetical protein IT179_17790 [Acidobacteria bacterium]|nr:hypothetical protein [Acidobacteriota bacterium]